MLTVGLLLLVLVLLLVLALVLELPERSPAKNGRPAVVIGIRRSPAAAVGPQGWATGSSKRCRKSKPPLSSMSSMSSLSSWSEEKPLDVQDAVSVLNVEGGREGMAGRNRRVGVCSAAEIWAGMRKGRATFLPIEIVMGEIQTHP